MQTEEILSSRNSNQSCPETSTTNSPLVRAKGGFQEEVSAYNERNRVNLNFCRAHFVYLIQKPSRGHYNFCISITQTYAVTPQTPESNKQNPRDRTLDLPFCFRYRHLPSLNKLHARTMKLLTCC